MKEFKTAKDLINAVTNEGVTEARLDLSKYGQDKAKIDEIRKLANFIKTDNRLKTLDASLNDLGNDGIEILADAIKSNNTITTLDIRGNRMIQNTDIEQIINLKTPFRTMLYRDTVTTGELALTRALLENTSLTKLKLFSTPYPILALVNKNNIFNNEADYQKGVVRNIIEKALENTQVDLPKEIIDVISNLTLQDANQNELRTLSSTCRDTWTAAWENKAPTWQTKMADIDKGPKRKERSWSEDEHSETRLHSSKMARTDTGQNGRF